MWLCERMGRDGMRGAGWVIWKEEGEGEGSWDICLREREGGGDNRG